MSTYVIGDVHGCYKELKSLLEKISFDLTKDRVIFVGDLVGRGPHALDVVQLVMNLGTSATHVLGNHDLYWLLCLLDLKEAGPSHQFPSDITASVKEDIIHWLLSSDLMFCDDENNCIVSHAGLSPEWSIPQAQDYAENFKKYIRKHGIEDTLGIIFSSPVLKWSSKLTPENLIRYTSYSFTQMRFCDEKEGDYTSQKCAPGPETQNLGIVPWFQLRRQRYQDTHHILFGHWASLGLYQDKNVTCCDTGCVWGNMLTAIDITHNFDVHQIQSIFHAKV